MILSQEQIEELLNIINTNQVVVIGTQLGSSFVTENDKALLNTAGIDFDKLYNPANDSIFTSFHFGMLAECLDKAFLNNFTFEQLKEYVSMGRYIPLTLKERTAIDTVKRQTFNDIKTLHGKIFSDVNQITINNTLEEQKEVLRNELIDGIADSKTIRQIANTIAEKTGDWSRDFDRIIACNVQQAYEEGKAAMIERNNEGEDPEVYKQPLAAACKHCVRLYLTKGVGSEPIVFKLSELRANGTNIGRKTDEWKPVVGFVHPYCRCPLHHKPKNSIWDNGKQQFVKQPNTPNPKRKPIRVWIAGKETFV